MFRATNELILGQSFILDMHDLQYGCRGLNISISDCSWEGLLREDWATCEGFGMGEGPMAHCCSLRSVRTIHAFSSESPKVSSYTRKSR